MVLYLYIVPFVIYPRFGDNGFKFAVLVAVIVSIAVLGTLFLGKRNKRRENERD
jgi:ABC-type sulfate transport system permease component